MFEASSAGIAYARVDRTFCCLRLWLMSGARWQAGISVNER